MIERMISDIDREIVPAQGDDELKTAMVAEMLVTLAGGAADKTSIMAKQGAYGIGLSDVPAWAVRIALNQWYAGAVKTLKVNSDEYRWPPAPGVLAIICRGILQPYRDAIADMKDVLAAKPLTETLQVLHRREV